MTILATKDQLDKTLKLLWRQAFVLASGMAAILGVVLSIHNFGDTPTQEGSYSSQVTTLNETEKNLKKLLGFVESQKLSIAKAQDTVKSLKAEHDKLSPLLKADKIVVDALLATQEDRQNSKMWVERGVSFVLGILASLLASVIYSMVNIRRRE